MSKEFSGGSQYIPTDPGQPHLVRSLSQWVRIVPLEPGEARWNRALTVEEIKALQSGVDPRTVASDALIAYRPLQPTVFVHNWALSEREIADRFDKKK